MFFRKQSPVNLVIPTLKPKRELRKINAIAQAQLIKLLLEGAYTCEQLAEETGLHYVTVLQYTRELHKAGAAHISSWEDDCRGRNLIKIYKLGEGRDAKRRKQSGAERQAAARERKRSAQLAAVTAGAGRFVQVGNGRLRYEVAA